MFTYEAFGLKIHSEISLPELKQYESEIPDLTIQLMKVDPNLGTALNEGFSFKTTKNAVYRFWDVIGKFKITKDFIAVDPVPGLNETVLRNFLLGTVFATFLRRRGLFVLHASSININNSAVAFSGFKGYGKSTTALAFYNSGYPLVTDDYITVEFYKDVPFVSPGFPSLRLSNESRSCMGLEKFNMDPEILFKTYAELPELFSNNKLHLRKVYMLQRGKKVEITPLKPKEAFMELVKNTFGIDMFSKSELPDNFFQCEKLVKTVDVSILEIPDSLDEIHKVVRMVEDDIKQQ